MPETTVGAIVTRGSDTSKILLTLRAVEPFKGRWCLPGGHIERDEAAERAVVREVEEETGLAFDARFFDYFDEILPEHDIHAVVMVFEGPGRGDLQLREEVREIRWFTLEEAQQLDLAFQHNRILDAYAARNITPDLRSEMLQEYAVLKEEVVERIDVRSQVLSFTLAIAGVFLTLGAQREVFVEPAVLLIYPLLAACLATIWAQNDIRTGQIGEYIKAWIEPRLKGLHWERYLSHEYGQRQNWLMRHIVELSTYGVFLLSQVGVVLVTAYQADWRFSWIEWVLLAFDAVALVLTAYFITYRRRRVHKQPADRSLHTG
jgi:8-oxo-dGTP diphosphatase